LRGVTERKVEGGGAERGVKERRGMGEGLVVWVGKTQRSGGLMGNGARKDGGGIGGGPGRGPCAGKH